jgi:hypothetical protein
MINKGKKCIASSCQKCNFFRHWNMVDDKGKKEVKQICSFDILFNEIPNLKGSIDGCQEATNKTFNKVERFGKASIETLKGIAHNAPKLLRMK